jgi:pimeloyl-ACP methyl ester carboxylesterase
MTILPLWYREYGDAAATATPVMLLHGLFGSSDNWHGIARQVAEQRRVLAIDLRNHGRSPWSREMSYPAMAADLIALIERLKMGRVALVGHSMGGKVGMWLALSQPHLVERLMVADMAPATYPRRFSSIVDALTGLDLRSITRRCDADDRLSRQLSSKAVRDYLLKNLVAGGDGWRWRMNLAALARGMEVLRAFPEAGGRQYPGPTLFLYGTESDYVSAEHLVSIRTLFPLARLRPVPGAGHWVYADRPQTFLRALLAFLRA